MQPGLPKLDVPLALLHVLEKMNNRQFLTLRGLSVLTAGSN
jgi:hypothetical protein